MELSKIIKEADYVALKDYCADKIASHISNRIQNSQTAFLAKVRGLTEEKDGEEKLEKESGDKGKATTEKDKEKEAAVS